jgi:alpha-tubulin suppressor-like RCC1 family protein
MGSAGGRHTVLLKGDGTAWASGSNSALRAGALGLGNYDEQQTFVQIPAPVDVVYVAAGHGCSFLVKRDGTVWATGMNTAGKLGLGDQVTQASPVQITALPGAVVQVACGNSFTLFLQRDATAWVTGDNLQGQYGMTSAIFEHLPGLASDRSYTPIQIPTTAGVAQSPFALSR